MRSATLLLIAFSFGLVPATSAPASVQDAAICLMAAERVDAGEALTETEKQEAHEACISALAATGSITQKQQFQDADVLITGTRHKF
jgi:hypothetical protein